MIVLVGLLLTRKCRRLCLGVNMKNIVELSTEEIKNVCGRKCDCICVAKERENIYAHMKAIGIMAGAGAVGLGIILYARMPPVLKLIVILSSVALPAMIKSSPPILECKCETNEC